MKIRDMSMTQYRVAMIDRACSHRKAIEESGAAELILLAFISDPLLTERETLRIVGPVWETIRKHLETVE